MSRVVRKQDFVYAKTAQLISAFVFTARIVRFLFFINLKFQASSLFLRLCRLVCVRPCRKPRRPVFSRHSSNALTITCDAKHVHVSVRKSLSICAKHAHFIPCTVRMHAYQALVFRNTEIKNQHTQHFSSIMRKPLLWHLTKSNTNWMIARCLKF